MQILSILVVDDESIIRKGLERAIHSLGEQYQVVAAVDDGESALEYLARMETLPDLVITDIFMKYVDGLELIEAINKRYPSIKCAILSGHEDFKLAQKAIDLKVCRFITKPVEISELQDVLRGIHQDIEAERLLKNDMIRLKHLHESNSIHVRDKMLYDLLEGRLLSNSDLRDYAHCFNFPIDGTLYGGIIRVLKYGPSDLERDCLLYGVAVKHLFTETILRSHSGFIIIKDHHTLIFGLSCEDSMSLFESAVIHDFDSLSCRILGIPTIMSTGISVAGLPSLPCSIMNAKEKLDCQLSQAESYPYEEERKVRLSLATGNQQLLHESLDVFFGRIIQTNYGVELVIRDLYRFVGSIEKHFQELGISVPNAPNLVQCSIPTAKKRIGSWLEAYFSNRRKNENTFPYNELVDKVKAYIDNRYWESDLSLIRLAELVSVHPNYLTQVFRKNRGLSCMQYLAKVRMERAKELLNSTNLKINEIADRVGYENPLYFSSYFKKWVGMNPTDFKEGLSSYV